MSVESASWILVFIFMAGGIFSVTASAMNLDWFFRHQSVRALTGRMSRNKARIVYLIIGAAIIINAVYLAKVLIES